MTATARKRTHAAPGMSTERPNDRGRCYYLLNEDQSADLEEYRFALRGLASIAGDILNGEQSSTTIERQEFSAVFSQLEKRLREIAPARRLGTVWLDDDGRSSAFRDASPLEPDETNPVF